MAKKPTESYNWTQDSDDSQRNDMGQSKRDVGFDPAERPPNKWHNWLWWISGKWNTWMKNLPVDQGESDTSFNINPGSNIENAGTKTTVIGSEDITLTDQCSSGTIDACSEIDTQAASDADPEFSLNAFSIKNCFSIDFYAGFVKQVSGLIMTNSSDITVRTGNHMRVENSSACTIKDDDSTIINSDASSASNGGTLINCTNCSIGQTGSTVHGCEDWDERDPYTDTFNNLRMIGKEFIQRSKAFLDNTNLRAFGHNSNGLFASREFSGMAGRYWYFQNATNYLKSASSGYASDEIVLSASVTTSQLTYGAPKQYGMESVSTSDAGTVSIPIADRTDFTDAPLQNQMLSMWMKLPDFAYGKDQATLATELVFMKNWNAADKFGWRSVIKDVTGQTSSDNVQQCLVTAETEDSDGTKHLCQFRLPRGVWFNFATFYNRDTLELSFLVDGEVVGILSMWNQVNSSDPATNQMLLIGSDVAEEGIQRFQIAEVFYRIATPADMPTSDSIKGYVGSVERTIDADFFTGARVDYQLRDSDGNPTVMDGSLIGITEGIAYFKMPSYMKIGNDSQADMYVDAWAHKYELDATN